jgi:hypothetical protein
MCYTQFGAYPNHLHITIIEKKQLVKKKEKGKRKKTKENHNNTDRD